MPTLDHHDPAPLDQLFHALSDPTRRAIVERLMQGPASVSELAQPFAMSLSAVVQHIQLLQASGLIQSQKTGRIRTCTLNRPKLDTALTWMELGRGETDDERIEREHAETPPTPPVIQGVFCLD